MSLPQSDFRNAQKDPSAISRGLYHVMSRGDQRDDIFLDDVDWHDFIKTLAEACQKADWPIHRSNRCGSSAVRIATLRRVDRCTRFA